MVNLETKPEPRSCKRGRRLHFVAMGPKVITTVIEKMTFDNNISSWLDLTCLASLLSRPSSLGVQVSFRRRRPSMNHD